MRITRRRCRKKEEGISEIIGVVSISMENTGDKDTAFLLGGSSILLNTIGDIYKKHFEPDKLLSGVYGPEVVEKYPEFNEWIQAADDLQGDTEKVYKIKMLDIFFVGTQSHMELKERD